MRRRKNFEIDSKSPLKSEYGDGQERYYIAYDVQSISATPKNIPPIGVFGVMTYSFAEKTIANMAKILVESCGDWIEEFDPFNPDFVSYTSANFYCAGQEDDFQDIDATVMLDNKEAIGILFYRIVGSFKIMDKDTVSEYLNWTESQWAQSKARPFETEIYRKQGTPMAQALECLLYHETWSLGIDFSQSPKFQSYIQRYSR